MQFPLPANGHYVICNAEKRPIWPDRTAEHPAGHEYTKHPPPMDRVQRAYESAYEHVGLIPWSLGLVVVDIDGSNKLKRKSFAENQVLIEELRETVIEKHGAPVCTVQSQSKAYHLFYRTDMPLKNGVWKYKEERVGEIRGATGHVVLWDIDEVAASLENIDDYDIIDPNVWPFTAPRKERKQAQHGGQRKGAGRRPAVSTMRGYLRQLDPNMGHDDWVRVGMALKNEGYDFSLWDKWSKGGDTYDEEVCRTKWESFKDGELKVGTIIYMAEEAAEARIEAGEMPRWVNVTQKGEPRNNSQANTVACLDVMGETFSYNEFTGEEFMGKKPIDDALASQIRHHIESKYDHVPTKDALYGAIELKCRQNTFHPVKDWMKDCHANWDGVKRLHHLGHYYFGTEDTPLQNQIAKLILMGMVARVWYPGAKFDYMPIVQSPEQGRGKSKALAILGGDWYSEGLPLDAFDLSKVLIERTAGSMIVECPDIGGMRAADIEKVKGVISATSDAARPAYGRKNVKRNRTFIVVGTANPVEILKDTQNRRFPILAVKRPIDHAALERDRQHLFGECMAELQHYVADGKAHITLPEALWDEAERHSKDYRVISYFEEWFMDWMVNNPDVVKFTSGQLKLDMNTAEIKMPHRQEWGRVLRTHGWEPNTGRQRGWVRTQG